MMAAIKGGIVHQCMMLSKISHDYSLHSELAGWLEKPACQFSNCFVVMDSRCWP